MTNQIDRNDVTPRMSKIVRHAGVIYLCGETAKGAATSDIKQQTRATLARVDALVVKAGSDRSRILYALSCAFLSSRSHSSEFARLPQTAESIQAVAGMPPDAADEDEDEGPA